MAAASGIGADTSIVIAGGATISTGTGAPERAVIAAGGGVYNNSVTLNCE